MDFKKILAKIDLFEGASMKAAEHNPEGPEFKGYWKGSDKNPPKPGMGVGGMEENILKDLSKGPKPKTKEQELAEAFEAFLEQLEEDNLGVEEKRPQRQGSRPAREYTSLDKPSKRYNYKKAVDEGTEMISKFRQELEALQASDKSPAEKQAIYSYLVDKFGKEAQEYKQSRQQIKEFGAAQPQGTAGQTSVSQSTSGQMQQDPKQAAATAQALAALKSGTKSTAPTPQIAKALDSASQGKPVGQQDMKALEPMMKDMTTVAQDPKLAAQFRTLAQQIQQVQGKQQTPTT